MTSSPAPQPADGRQAVLELAAKNLNVPVEQAAAAAVYLLSVVADGMQDGGALFLRYRKATTAGLQESYVKVDVRALVDGALEIER